MNEKDGVADIVVNRLENGGTQQSAEFFPLFVDIGIAAAEK